MKENLGRRLSKKIKSSIEEKIKIEEINLNKKGIFWRSFWTNSPKPYPPAMPGVPKILNKNKAGNYTI